MKCQENDTPWFHKGPRNPVFGTVQDFTLCVSSFAWSWSVSFKSVIIRTVFSWILLVILVNYQTWQRVVETPQIRTRWSKVCVEGASTCQWHLKWRQSGLQVVGVNVALQCQNTKPLMELLPSFPTQANLSLYAKDITEWSHKLTEFISLYNLHNPIPHNFLLLQKYQQINLQENYL